MFANFSKIDSFSDAFEFDEFDSILCAKQQTPKSRLIISSRTKKGPCHFFMRNERACNFFLGPEENICTPQASFVPPPAYFLAPRLGKDMGIQVREKMPTNFVFFLFSLFQARAVRSAAVFSFLFLKLLKSHVGICAHTARCSSSDILRVLLLLRAVSPQRGRDHFLCAASLVVLR